mgnify:CR=1 FL=1
MKRYYMLETNDADKSAELYIFGDITSYPWYEDEVSAYGLVKQLQDMDVEHIKVHINSYGGEVKEGLAIYNALKDSKMKQSVTVLRVLRHLWCSWPEMRESSKRHRY